MLSPPEGKGSLLSAEEIIERIDAGLDLDHEDKKELPRNSRGPMGQEGRQDPETQRGTPRLEFGGGKTGCLVGGFGRR